MASNKERAAAKSTAKKPDKKPADKSKDPRETAAGAKTGTVVATHEAHLADPGSRRRLADLDPPAGTNSTATKGKDDIVTVTVPHPYRLQMLGGEGGASVTHQYDAGINEMPRSHAEHEYSIANGVEIVDA